MWTLQASRAGNDDRHQHAGTGIFASTAKTSRECTELSLKEFEQYENRIAYE
jgi:hypothetical protein